MASFSFFEGLPLSKKRAILVSVLADPVPLRLLERSSARFDDPIRSTQSQYRPMKTDYIAFYGSLMERANDETAPSRAGLSNVVQRCRLAGVIRDHGRYPGFFPLERNSISAAVQPGAVVEAELHQLLTPHALTVFDRWEDYDPQDEINSPYLRRRIRLIEPDQDAWVYISQLSDEDPVVPEGDWAAYRKAHLER